MLERMDDFSDEAPTVRIPYESLQAVADSWRAQMAKERAEMEGRS